MVEESLLETIVYTLMPDKLRGLIGKSMLFREVKFIKKRNLNVKVLPEFSELFNNAPCLSSKIILFSILLGSNGKFHYLIKNVGNKRENMIKEQKDIEERKEFKYQLASKDREINLY